MAKQISEFSWEKRLLVISYKKQDDQIFIKTKKFISDNKCGIDDRNLEIIFLRNLKIKILKHQILLKINTVSG